MVVVVREAVFVSLGGDVLHGEVERVGGVGEVGRSIWVSLDPVRFQDIPGGGKSDPPR